MIHSNNNNHNNNNMNNKKHIEVTTTTSALYEAAARRNIRRRRKRPRTVTTREKALSILVLVLSFGYMGFLWRTQTYLDSLEAHGHFRIPTLLRGGGGGNGSGGVVKKLQTGVKNAWHKLEHDLSQLEHLVVPGASAPVAPVAAAAAGAVDAAAAEATKRKEKPENIPKPKQQEKAAVVAVPAAAAAAQNVPPPPQQHQHVKNTKYLIFNGFVNGQGAGNVISGLLATHLLGIEFNRTVCVSPMYQDFLTAFEPADPAVAFECDRIIEKNRNRLQDRDAEIRLNNFGTPPNECELQKVMASDQETLVVNANTYPRWPIVPDNFFFTYYKAKPELINMLPYDPQHPPTTVVHLREPDGMSDLRHGLDEDTFRALGETLPADTYLVTNRPAWYDYFEQQYHWQHPNWHEILHSALRKSWGARPELPFNGGGDGLPAPKPINLAQLFDHDNVFQQPVSASAEDARLQILQMWADWYTILTAKTVYHTHSDFSISAIHWQNIQSKTIDGYDTYGHYLKLVDESWRRDGETARLVDRRVGAPGTSELRLCMRGERGAW